MTAPAIETRALRKVYPAPAPPRRRAPGTGHPGGHPGGPPPDRVPAPGAGGVVALEALDLAVAEGEFFGLGATCA